MIIKLVMVVQQPVIKGDQMPIFAQYSTVSSDAVAVLVGRRTCRFTGSDVKSWS